MYEEFGGGTCLDVDDAEGRLGRKSGLWNMQTLTWRRVLVQGLTYICAVVEDLQVDAVDFGERFELCFAEALVRLGEAHEEFHDVLYTVDDGLMFYFSRFFEAGCYACPCLQFRSGVRASNGGSKFFRR